MPPPLPGHLPRYRLPAPPPLSALHLLIHPQPPGREGARLARRARSQVWAHVVLVRPGPHEYHAAAAGLGGSGSGSQGLSGVEAGG